MVLTPSYRRRSFFARIFLEIHCTVLFFQQFKSVKFDQINQWVDFSKDTPFAPENPTDWQAYPFEEKKASCLFKQLCDGNEKIATSRQIHGKVFGPFIGGQLNNQIRIVKNLQFHDQTREETFLVILEESCSCVKTDFADGLIGLPFFEDMVMVLDFEGKIMWVKNKI